MAEAKVIIVGGGISGLATAYFLAKARIRSVIIEKSNRLGGLIKTDVVQGCRLEAGPDSYLAAKPAVTELAAGLGELGNQIIGSNDQARRILIARNGKLIAMPTGMVMMVPAHLTAALRNPLFSTQTKLRLLIEPLFQPRNRPHDITVQEFIGDHFGSEFRDYVAEPLLSGVYGGTPDTLSAASTLPRFIEYERMYGSLIRGVRRERPTAKHTSTFLSFRDGMQSLTDALFRACAESIEVVHSPATRIDRSANRWRVQLEAGSILADHVMLACPAHAARDLLESAEPALASKLSRIPYSSAILCNLGYERSKLPEVPEGFGFLVPAIERHYVAAATWVGAKFLSRLPANITVLRAFIVGAEADECMAATDDALVERIREDIGRLLGIDQRPLFQKLHRWPASMPQYILGHAQLCRDIADIVEARPGLHLVSNYFDGVGIPDSVRAAKETAKRVMALTGN